MLRRGEEEYISYLLLSDDVILECWNARRWAIMYRVLHIVVTGFDVE